MHRQITRKVLFYDEYAQGLLSAVKSAAKTLNTPDKSPAPPMAWIACPEMNILEDEATDATKDLTMNAA